MYINCIVMESSNFDKLLDRYLTGNVTEQERVKIEAWLDVVKTSDNLILSPEDEEQLFKRIINASFEVDQVVSFRPDSNRLAKLRGNRFVRMAASLLLLACASYFIARQFGSDVNVVVVTQPIEKVILDDGSILWMHKGSELSYDKNTFMSHRDVTLQGEALFEVAKDASHPFTIVAGDMKVTVLGTSFSIRTDLKEIHLKVITGKVKLTSLSDTDGINVMPNENVIYTSQGKKTMEILQPADIAEIIHHTDYNMAFRNIPLGEVFAKIEKKFNVNINVASVKMNECQITGDFSDHSLGDTMDLLSDMLEMHYEINARTVFVTGSGCN